MRSCAGCDCGGSGHKAYVAQKAWHGRFPFIREYCLLDADVGSTPPDTKYLAKIIEARIESSAHIEETKFIYAGPGACDGGVETDLEADATFLDIRQATIAVDRYSGVITLDDCECSRAVDFPTVPGLDVSANLLFWPDILCDLGFGASFRLPWIDILVGLDACDGRISHAIGGACGQTAFPDGTPTEIEDHFNASTDDGLGNTTDVTCVVTLSERVIEITITNDYTVAGASLDRCGNPYSYAGSGTSTAYVKIELPITSAYTSSQVNDDVETLLAARDLTDDTYYTWHHGCVYPFVFYDETLPRSPDEYFLSSAITDGTTLSENPCDWVDSNATEGGHAGDGFTGDLINGSGAISEWYWIAPGLLPAGAFKDFSSGILVAAKYAEMLHTRLAHNWFRPCGDDRLLPDLCSGYLYPTAWAICGVVTIEPAPGSGVPAVTGNGVSPIVITVSHSRAIVTGDPVDVSGVTGNTAANGSGISVTTVGSFYVVDDIAYQDLELDGTTGNGAYISGGEVRNAASLSPPNVWDDDSAKGDYLYLHYAFDLREVALDPTIRQYNSEYGMPPRIKTLTVTEGNLDFSASPRVVSISPDGAETWTNGDAYAFDAAAMPLPCDERFGSLWCGQVQQRMLDPIDHATTIEARASVPVGAPALPVVTPGCCGPYGEPACPFVHIMSIAEITALGTGSVPTGIIAAPLFSCYAFDDDP